MPNTTQKTMKKTAMSQSEIQEWLVQWVAKEVQKSSSDIDPKETFINLGLSSRQAISLTGEIEDTLGKEVDVSIAWDYPTIKDLSQYLAKS
jgi:acyl carrier protein